MAIYETEFFGELYTIRGDFAEASCPIYRRNDDGEWIQTIFQVASFRHWPEQAMRHELRSSTIESGDDPDSPDIADKIDVAVRDMQAREDCDESA